MFSLAIRVQVGELKGVDCNGNQYWEDLEAVTGRNRYVVYSGDRRKIEASTIPAEWHSWIHGMQDSTPVEVRKTTHTREEGTRSAERDVSNEDRLLI